MSIHRYGMGAASMLLAASMLSGCEQIEARQAVREELRDPQSARFEDVRPLPDGRVCGYVNSKNGFGAYTGRQPFVFHAGLVSFVPDASSREIEAEQIWEQMGTFGVSRTEYRSLQREHDALKAEIETLKELTAVLFGDCPTE